MTMIDRLKTPPMAVGLFLAGLLLFAVIGIARNVSGATVAQAAQNSVEPAVQRVEVVNIQPATITALGGVQTDQSGDRWIWLGNGWLSCRHIDAATRQYSSIRTDPMITAWHRLPTGEQDKVLEVCR